MTLRCEETDLAAISLSPAEVEALLDVPERKVRKEIEHGIVRGTSFALPRVAFDAAVYLRVLVLLREMEPPVEGRKSLRTLLRNALLHKRLSDLPEDLELASQVFHIRLRSVALDVCERVFVFTRWKEERVVTDSSILGGEPVFRGSRLSVRHVGTMLERGESVEVIREDYPYLTAADVEFARRFARAYPRLGRPRESA